MYQNTEEAMKLREENRKIVERYFTETPRDPKVFYNMTATFRVPFFYDGETLLNPELPEGAKTQRQKNHRLFGDTVLYNIKIYGTDDPNFFWTFHMGKTQIMRQDGKYYNYENSYVQSFRFENGKIEEIAEYANPLRLMDGFGIEHPELPTPDETNRRYEELGLFKPM